MAAGEQTYLADNYRYMLATVVDTNGNQVTYDYTCRDYALCLVDTISYNGTQIKFYWEVRPDLIRYAAGFGLAEIDRRLKSIGIRTSGALVRAYGIDYIQRSSGDSLVWRVRQWGSDASIDTTGTSPTYGTVSGGTALPHTVFDYPANGALFGTASNFSFQGTWSGDFNGDGRADLAEHKRDPDLSYLPGGNIVRACEKITIRLTGVSGTAGTKSAQVCTYSMLTNPEEVPAWLSGDFDGDGRTELIATCCGRQPTIEDPSIGRSFNNRFKMVLNATTGEYDIVVTGVPSLGIPPYVNPAQGAANPAAYGIARDFTGDGKVDILRGSMFVSTGAAFTAQTWTGGSGSEFGRLRR